MEPLSAISMKGSFVMFVYAVVLIKVKPGRTLRTIEEIKKMELGMSWGNLPGISWQYPDNVLEKLLGLSWQSSMKVSGDIFSNILGKLLDVSGKALGNLLAKPRESSWQHSSNILTIYLYSNLRRHHHHRDTPWGNCVEGNRIRENPYRTSLRIIIEGNTQGKSLKEILKVNL